MGASRGAADRRRARRVAAGGLALGAALGAVPGCAGFDLAQMPGAPIAFVHRTRDEGERRAELLDPEARPRPIPGASILHADSVMEYLRRDTPERALLETFGRLALLDPHTGEVTRLPIARPGAQPLEWSADHRRLLFVSLRHEQPQVLEYDFDRRELRRVTRHARAHPTASLAPDGRVAFAQLDDRGEELASRIWVRPAGGAEARPVTPGPSDFRPRWSPDGEVLVFATLLGGRVHAIGAVDPASGTPPRIIARGRDPVFTRDGAWIVYSQEVRDHWRLWRMRPDGTGKGAIGGGPLGRADELHPAVSPDGAFVVYVSSQAGRDRLRVRRFDGSGDRPLLEGSDGAVPVW